LGAFQCLTCQKRRPLWSASPWGSERCNMPIIKSKSQKEAIVKSFDGHWLDFYSRFIEVGKLHGSEVKAPCPFHPDSDPSLSINNDVGLFRCFGCGVSGDAFDFYAKIKEVSAFPEILKNGNSHIIRYIPALLIEEVNNLYKKIIEIIPDGLLKIEGNSGFISKEETINIIFSLIVNFFQVTSGKLSGGYAETSVEKMFLQGCARDLMSLSTSTLKAEKNSWPVP